MKSLLLQKVFLRYLRPTLKDQAASLVLLSKVLRENGGTSSNEITVILDLANTLERLYLSKLTASWGDTCITRLKESVALISSYEYAYPVAAIRTAATYQAIRFESNYGAMREGVGVHTKVCSTAIEYTAIGAAKETVSLLMENRNFSESVYQLKDVHYLMIDLATRTHLKEYVPLWIALSGCALEILSRFTPTYSDEGTFIRPVHVPPTRTMERLLELRACLKSSIVEFHKVHRPHVDPIPTLKVNYV